MIDCNIKENRKKVRRNVIDVIRVTNERGYPYAQMKVDELIEIDSVLERQEEIIEDQEERIAIMSEGDTEAMLNKACETIANFDLDFVCDDNTLDDGWCNEHCKATGQKPECFRHWLLKQTTEPPKEGDVDG